MKPRNSKPRIPTKTKKKDNKKLAARISAVEAV